MEDNTSEYAVFDVQRLEVHDKAQVLVYACLSQQKATTKQRLERVLTELYEQYKDTTGFRRFGRPTVVNAYLFTSEELGRKDPSAYIGWLWKGPKDAEPNMSIDEVMLADVRAWDAQEWTKDMVGFEQLNRSLFDRGLELCSFHKRVREIERKCQQQADLRYPGFGVEHAPYVEELLAAATNDIKAVHKLDDDLLYQVQGFARVHCR